MTTFEKLSAINVNDHVEKKNGLTYLSWAWAWAEVKRNCPDANYKILPFEFNEELGYMCRTEVTIAGETLSMWLPVMDGANKAMLHKPYAYFVKAWENGRKIDVQKECLAASMFDINKTNMRCLVKNLAMFGLGLYIYAGEDLPEIVEAPTVAQALSAPDTEVVEQIVSLPDLKKGSDNWTNVVNYATSNKGLGIDKIVNQVSRKYKVSPALKKELKKLVEPEQGAAELPLTVEVDATDSNIATTSNPQ